MKAIGIVLLAVAAILVLVAWTYDFPGERVIERNWDASRGAWGAPKVVRDETRPLRWMFTGVGGASLLAGGALLLLGQRNSPPALPVSRSKER